MITTHLSAVLLSHPKGALHPERRKRVAEIAENAEIPRGKQ